MGIDRANGGDPDDARQRRGHNLRVLAVDLLEQRDILRGNLPPDRRQERALRTAGGRGIRPGGRTFRLIRNIGFPRRRRSTIAAGQSKTGNHHG